jgi:hypothetical protein
MQHRPVGSVELRVQGISVLVRKCWIYVGLRCIAARMFKQLVCLFALGTSLGITLASCAAEVTDSSAPAADEKTGEASSNAVPACRNSCDCALGSLCTQYPNGKFCEPWGFGPLPPTTPCFAQCQCPYGSQCVFGKTPPSVMGQCVSVSLGSPCQSACDCGPDFVCDATHRCNSQFGPYAECTCNQNCPYTEQCVSGHCN